MQATRFRTAVETMRPSICTAWRIVDRDHNRNKPAFELARVQSAHPQSRGFARVRCVAVQIPQRIVDGVVCNWIFTFIRDLFGSNREPWRYTFRR